MLYDVTAFIAELLAQRGDNGYLWSTEAKLSDMAEHELHEPSGRELN